MNEVGDPKKVVLDVYFRQPFVLDAASGLRDAGAIVAGFGISDTRPDGRAVRAVRPAGPAALRSGRDPRGDRGAEHRPPGYDETKDGALFPFGFGLTYP